MSKTQIFIDKARAVHGDRYDYSKVIYFASKEAVEIICTVHGVFMHTPNSHLSGRGCLQCSGKYMPRTNEWIERARKVHGERYEYFKTDYKGSKNKVIITCKTHGDFTQKATGHLYGDGCPKCSGKHTYSVSEWIEKAKDVHGDRYIYDKSIYVKNSCKLTITCKKHGDFKQTAKVHTDGKGCPKCPRRYDQETNLYLMENGLGKIKIGYSINVRKRLTQLNQKAPFMAQLLETWTLPDTPTALKIESKVHRKLAKYHAGLSGFNGATEWFNASPDAARKYILDAIRGSHVVNNYVKNNPQMSLI